MNRRAFLKTLGAGCAGLTTAGAYAQQVRPYDILIRNGEVRSPGQTFRSRSDIAILDGRIAAIEESIAADRALDVVNASGLYVTPGLIDLHTHCFWGGTATG
jgi:dihydroorotase